jgi:hypothetical protein
MRRSSCGRAVVVALSFMLGFGASVAAGEGPDRAELEDQLRATEVAFARTMADRNHRAFVGFLDPETTFFGRLLEFLGDL